MKLKLLHKNQGVGNDLFAYNHLVFISEAMWNPRCVCVCVFTNIYHSVNHAIIPFYF
jgi:hypothetical protein